MSEPDFFCYDPAELDYDKLDPGIREVVRFLVDMGFHTTDSGDGKFKYEHGWEEDELVPYPHVYMTVKPAEIAVACYDLRGCLRGAGIEIAQAWAEEGKPHIEAIFDPVTDVAVVGLFNVTSDMMPSRT